MLSSTALPVLLRLPPTPMGPASPDLPQCRPPAMVPRFGVPVAARSFKLALTVAHSLLASDRRERFAEDPRPRAVEHVPYTTDDGWRCSLYRCPPLPGATGEPVLLAHALGMNRLSLDYGTGDGLVGLLHAWGFDVWLWEHRADASAFAPRRARAFDADDIATQDLPAALDCVRARTSYPRVGWVGHGLGGQLLYLHLAQEPGSPIFAAACLGAAVRFPTPSSTARTAAAVASLLPARLGLPARQVMRLLSPGTSADPFLGHGLCAGGIEGPRLRGLMNHGIEDLSGGLVRQVARWLSEGSLCDAGGRIDCLEAIRGLPLALLAVAADDDSVCPPEAAFAAVEALGQADTHTLRVREPCGHLDLIHGEVCTRVTGPAVAAWLDAHRRRAW